MHYGGIMDDYRIEVNGNEIYFFGDIHDVSSCKFIHEFMKISSNKNNDCCKVFFNSPGGVCSAGLGMYDVVKNSIIPTDFFCVGQVGSMATVVMLSGRSVQATPNTTFLLHELSAWGVGKLSEVKDNVKHSEILDKLMTSIYKSKIKKEKWKVVLKNMRSKDWYFDVNMALDIGLIDGIYKKEE